MKLVEYHRYWVTAHGRKREYLTSFPMTAEQAARSYASYRPDPSTRFTRMEPETEEEIREAQMDYPSAGWDSVQPPRRKE